MASIASAWITLVSYYVVSCVHVRRRFIITHCATAQSPSHARAPRDEPTHTFARTNRTALLGTSSLVRSRTLPLRLRGKNSHLDPCAAFVNENYSQDGCVVSLSLLSGGHAAMRRLA